MTYVCSGQQEISFDELINEMIAEAWYMVTEYHLNLGPRDTLEKVVNHIASVSNMQPTIKKQELLEWLKECRDTDVITFKKTLSKEVPFRLQELCRNGWNT